MWVKLSVGGEKGVHVSTYDLWSEKEDEIRNIDLEEILKEMLRGLQPK